MKDTVKINNCIYYERGGTQRDTYAESDVTSTPCPLCNNNSHKAFYKERGVLGIVICSMCNLIYVNPRLKDSDKIYWGDADKYFKEARLIFEGKAKHHRDTNYMDDLKIIHRYKPSGNFLDIGTNMGFFLKNAKAFGWRLYGVEPSPSLSELGRKYFGLNIKTAFLEDSDFESDFFDIVTMTDVFEHISNPKMVLCEIYRILKSDGILFVKVPNGLFNLFKFYAAKFTKRLKDYDIFDSYEHIVHYSDKTLKNMLAKYGFKVIKTYIGKPIQLPTWHKYVGYFYQYPMPFCLDFKRRSARNILYFLSCIEFKLRLNRVGYLAPNIIAVARKEQR